MMDVRINRLDAESKDVSVVREMLIERGINYIESQFDLRNMKCFIWFSSDDKDIKDILNKVGGIYRRD